MLQRGSYIIRVASLYSIRCARINGAGNSAPEVEILGHVYLLEHIQESIFFGDLFYAMIVADWNDFCTFAMIYIVSA